MTTLGTILLLIGSNLFMTYAWYGHLRDFKEKPLWIVVALSWGVAFFEYCLQVPANRIGYQQAGLSLQQLKVMQEVLALSVFAVFAVVYMRERITVNFIYASLCIVAAAWFMFRDIKSVA
ncbi:MAG: DMT family protein [Planctomycetes bacterium]|nr:DMT family protein [Planctomycetota bacterium]